MSLTEASDLDLCVADNGPGIDRALMKTVKDVFVTTRAQGTGLGLSVVDTVARRHGGQFVLQSEVGRGTRARLQLPLAQLTHTAKYEAGV